MIKGVDAQIMTQRATEYSKDVNAMLRRDELANEFADRMNKINTRQETKTVTHLEKAEHARVNGDQEKESKRREQQHKQARDEGEHGGEARPRETELPAVGEGTETHLLDIEI